MVLLGSVATIGLTLQHTMPAYAATPPDTCFDFSAGTINNYYDNEDSNGANPACPRNVDIPSTIGGVTVANIATNAFNAKSLTAVTLPSTLVTIGFQAFRSNELTTLTLPNSVTTIGDASFFDNNLTAVTLSNQLTAISESAFSSNNLASITFPASVTSIGPGAFAGNNFTSVTIPATVTHLGQFTFGFEQLQTVTLLGTPTIDSPGLNAPIGQELSGQLNLCFSTMDPPPAVLADYIPCYNSATALYSSNRLFALYYTPNPALYSDYAQVYEELLTSQAIGVPSATLYIGQLINPAAITLRYVDSNGSDIQPPQQLTGMRTNGTFITSYQLGDAGLPVLADPENPTPTEQSQMDAALAQYYRIGQNINLTPPAITGYTAPDAQSIVLADSGNEITFVYGGGSAGNQDDDLLAETGVSAPLALVIGIIVATASTAVLIRRLR